MELIGFRKKLVAVQAELKAPKSQYNSFGKYKYRTCEDIMEALKPLLAKHGLCQTISDDIKVIGDRVYVQALVSVHDVDSDSVTTTSAFAREALTKKGMDESQITGTASSYARKYALNGMWMIDDSKDSDHHTATLSDDSHFEYVKKVNACASVADLKTVWSAIPDSIQPRVKAAVNKKKQELVA